MSYGCKCPLDANGNKPPRVLAINYPGSEKGRVLCAKCRMPPFEFEEVEDWESLPRYDYLREIDALMTDTDTGEYALSCTPSSAEDHTQFPVRSGNRPAKATRDKARAQRKKAKKHQRRGKRGK